ncbi:MAG TPA: hypothetical protein DDY52_02070 [Candidatus Moranbacteria bacterium]|nr:MAG: hypothetical protein UR51_C0002G0077 [Candidatus Moranbacteria bacterium GW2011_GWF1_34_10]HBI16923.1 hypothetical protein [Candidatus Moranbacteria bacterium]
MELVICQGDLREEHIHRDTSLVKFEHFNPGVQGAIIFVGKATFDRHKKGRREECTDIYPPKINND